MKDFENIILKDSWDLIIPKMPLRDIYKSGSNNEETNYTMLNIVFNRVSIYS